MLIAPMAEGLLADNAADALRCYRLAIAQDAFPPSRP